MEITLKGLVASNFGNATELSRALNWSESKARAIVSGRQAPSAKDMMELADILGIKNPKDFMSIFFPSKSTMWTDTA